MLAAPGGGGGRRRVRGRSRAPAAVARGESPAGRRRECCRACRTHSGLHLDGLADTADGLGSGKPAEDALRIMKQSDIGPFGVLALVFVVLGQVAALAQLYGDSWGAVRSGRSSRGRCSVGADSRRPGGVPAARPEGLGAAVAGVVPVRSAVGLVVGVVVVGGVCGWGLGVYGVVPAVVVALVVAELLLRHCRRRFGGVTGDVFGGLRRVRRLLRSWCFRWVDECGGQPAPLSGLPSRVFDRNRVLSRVGAMLPGRTSSPGNSASGGGSWRGSGSSGVRIRRGGRPCSP